MNQSKLFTPQEATQTLPLVKRIVEDILGLGQRIREKSLAVRESIGAGVRPEEDPEVLRLVEQLEELFDEIEILGCYYKDWNFSVGLVDFPAALDGREVLLCWRSDEEGLKYYHDMDAGYAGRKPIPASAINLGGPAFGGE